MDEVNDFLKDVLEGIGKAVVIIVVGSLLSAPPTLLMVVAVNRSSWVFGVLALLCLLLTIGIGFALMERAK